MLIALIKFSNKQERTIITRRSFFPRWDKVEEFSLIFIDRILGLLFIYVYTCIYTNTARTCLTFRIAESLSAMRTQLGLQRRVT